MQPTKYFASKWKTTYLAVGSCGFSAIGVAMLCNAYGKDGLMPQFLLGIAGTSFFGTIGTYLLWKIVRWEPSVVLGDAGMYDAASMFPAGLVPWAEIEGVAIRNVGRGQKALGVYLKDPSRYLARLGPLRRAVTRFVIACGWPPISIPGVSVNVPLEQLEREIAAWLSNQCA